MHCIQSFLTSKRQLGKLQCFPKELFQWLFFLCFHPVGRDTWQGSTAPPGCWALGLFCCLTLARQTAQREAGVGTVGKGSSMEGVSVTSAGLGLRSSSFSVSWLWSSFTASPLCLVGSKAFWRDSNLAGTTLWCRWSSNLSTCLCTFSFLEHAVRKKPSKRLVQNSSTANSSPSSVRLPVSRCRNISLKAKSLNVSTSAGRSLRKAFLFLCLVMWRI